MNVCQRIQDAHCLSNGGMVPAEAFFHLLFPFYPKGFRRCGGQRVVTLRVGRKAGDAPERDPELVKFGEHGFSLALDFRVVFFGIFHGEPLFDEAATFVLFAHLHFDGAKRDVMHQAVRI
jgi:hypothetical protein